MNVDPSKVNLAEKDIEDWLFENPKLLTVNGHVVDGWIGRQISVPSGIIDLLGYMKTDRWIWLVVVEIKNTTFNQSAILQVCRYAADVDLMYQQIPLDDEKRDWSNGVTKVVIAKGEPDNQLLFEANAVDVNLISFNVSFSLSTSGTWGFNREYSKKRHNDLTELAESGIFDIVSRKEDDLPDVFKDAIDKLPPDDGNTGEQ